MTQYGTWTPYAGKGAIFLAVTLLIVSGLLAGTGWRLRHSLRVPRPGTAVGTLLILLWFVSLAMFVFAITIYVRALFQQYGQFTPPTSPITPITIACGVVTFLAIAYVTRRYGLKVSLASAIVGSAAAPMIFELPFDFIVMFRLYPPVSIQNTLLYFVPLVLVELSSYSLLTLSPAMHVSRIALYSLAAMFLVFSVWAWFGFSYPSAPAPFALNAVSKILSFGTAIALFVPEQTMRTVIQPRNH